MRFGRRPWATPGSWGMAKVHTCNLSFKLSHVFHTASELRMLLRLVTMTACHGFKWLSQEAHDIVLSLVTKVTITETQ